MPGLDHSGPQGKGAMTGRKTGLCVGNNKNEFFGSSRGRRGGMGFGRGMGRGNVGRGYGFGRSGRDVPMGYEQSALDKESLQEEIKQARLYLSELEEKLQKLGNNK